MKIITPWFVAMVAVFLLLTPVQAGWKEKMAKNQIKTINYIMQLRQGADPDKIPPPRLRRDSKAKAGPPLREMREAIEVAERYARAGQHKKIKVPKFKYKLVSDKRYNELKKELREQR